MAIDRLAWINMEFRTIHINSNKNKDKQSVCLKNY